MAQLDSQTHPAVGKRARHALAEDELAAEHGQEHQAKKQRPISSKSSNGVPASVSKLSDADRKRSEMRKRNDEHKKATANQKPTAKEHLSALSSEKFNILEFDNADIDAAFEDPTMRMELASTDKVTVTAGEHLTVASSSSFAPAPTSSAPVLDPLGGVQQPAEEVAPRPSSPELYYGNRVHDCPSFVEAFTYLNYLESIEERIAARVSAWEDAVPEAAATALDAGSPEPDLASRSQIILSTFGSPVAAAPIKHEGRAICRGSSSLELIFDICIHQS
ncbi:MAG: hypothetical protein L6R39_004723 [Caloplaca ligustica]|nr:MAG: hypothetical protein L6R39_004723 [Caloplaca ligustica]